MGKPATQEEQMSGDEALTILKVLRKKERVSEADITGARDEIRARTQADVGAVVRAKKPVLSREKQETLVATLRVRFNKHSERHPNVQWSAVEKALLARLDLMVVLERLEATGGEPDVCEEDDNTFLFGDCSAESPSGRRNCVFDKVAEAGLGKGTFNGNAVDMAAGYGADLMDDAQYRALQKLGKFDSATWSWLKTPDGVRESGGALFGNRDGEYVFVYGIGATDHDGSGAFRCVLRVPKA